MKHINTIDITSHMMERVFCRVFLSPSPSLRLWAAICKYLLFDLITFTFPVWENISCKDDLTLCKAFQLAEAPLGGSHPLLTDQANYLHSKEPVVGNCLNRACVSVVCVLSSLEDVLTDVDPRMRQETVCLTVCSCVRGGHPVHPVERQTSAVTQRDNTTIRLTVLPHSNHHHTMGCRI